MGDFLRHLIAPITSFDDVVALWAGLTILDCGGKLCGLFGVGLGAFGPVPVALEAVQEKFRVEIVEVFQGLRLSKRSVITAGLGGKLLNVPIIGITGIECPFYAVAAPNMAASVFEAFCRRN